MLTVTPSLLDNPRFLAMQVRQIYEFVAPDFIAPILQEGMDDGSIPAKNPRELAEAIMILSNVWLNPLVSQPDAASMRRRCNTFNALLSGMGIDNLLDTAMIDAYAAHCHADAQ